MAPQPRAVEEIDVPLRDGGRLYAQAYGDRRAAVTVLLLHGWTLDRRIWHRQVTHLPTKAGMPTRVIAYDARGHGRSCAASRDVATLAQLGDDLAEVIDQLAGDGPVVLVGHSLGGMTMMEYAHRHPADFARRVGGLVMVGTTAEGHAHTRYGLPLPLSRLVRMAELSSTYVFARCGTVRPHRAVMPAVRPGMRWLLFGETYEQSDLALAASAVARASLCSIGGFRASVGAQHRLDTLAALPPLPTAVLVGEQDKLTPVRCAESIARALGDVPVTRCAGAGHMLMLERPSVVNREIARVTREAAGSNHTRLCDAA
ncbi:MAG TPA: alpha/beta hydrolase [Pilimelia sp.]|nr:alpha/beta hydrolase [Pilimelia sp.]